MPKFRYNINGKNSDYVEHSDRSFLVTLRKNNKNFKGQHIKRSLQIWDDLVIEGRIYPSKIIERNQFYKFNERCDLHAKS